MERFGGSGFNHVSAIMKKRRSATSRRPWPKEQRIMENHDMSHPLNNSRKNSPDETGGSDAGFRWKEFYVRDPLPRRSSVNKTRDKTSSKKVKRDDKTSGGFDGCYGSGCSEGENGSDLNRCSECALTPGNWKSSDKTKESFEMQSKSPDGCMGRSGDGHDMHQAEGPQSLSVENKLRKVKLKLGGVTHTIHARSNLEAGNGGSSTKPPCSSDAFRYCQKLSPKDISNGHSQEKGNGFQGDAWKDSSGLNFSRGAKDDSRGEGISGKQTDKLHGISASEPLRRSKRVSKRHVDDAVDDGEEDAEICYLEKLKNSEASADQIAEFEDTREDSVKKRKIAKPSKKRNTPYELDAHYAISRSNKESRRMPRSARESDDVDYVEEEEPGSAGGPEAKRKKEKTSVDSPADVRTAALTTRQRALQSGKCGNDESVIEFPNGLPPAPSRKQKVKLSEVEIQAKKAEAAQRRRMQVEKAARESEADAIRKILGLDSDKRKEEKKQKEREVKAAKSQELATSNIRWIMGPTGTVVTFPEDVGLPCIFSSKPCSYPPPREKCAGPSCTNEYKYRDSKSKLPLCSLQCYSAVQGNARPLTTC